MNKKSIKKLLIPRNILCWLVGIIVSFIVWHYQLLNILNLYNEAITWVITLWIGLSASLITLTLLVPVKDNRTTGARIVGGIIFYGIFFGLLVGVGTGVGWLTDQVVYSVSFQLSPLKKPTNEKCQFISSLPMTNTKGSLGKLWVNTEFNSNNLNRDEAKSIEELNTLICVTKKEVTITTCNYTNGVKIVVTRADWYITLIDWKTSSIRAKRSFEGEVGYCPETTRAPDKSKGNPPSTAEVREW